MVEGSTMIDKMSRKWKEFGKTIGLYQADINFNFYHPNVIIILILYFIFSF